MISENSDDNDNRIDLSSISSKSVNLGSVRSEKDINDLYLEMACVLNVNLNEDEDVIKDLFLKLPKFSATDESELVINNFAGLAEDLKNCIDDDEKKQVDLINLKSKSVNCYKAVSWKISEDGNHITQSLGEDGNSVKIIESNNEDEGNSVDLSKLNNSFRTEMNFGMKAISMSPVGGTRLTDDFFHWLNRREGYDLVFISSDDFGFFDNDNLNLVQLRYSYTNDYEKLFLNLNDFSKEFVYQKKTILEDLPNIEASAKLSCLIKSVDNKGFRNLTEIAVMNFDIYDGLLRFDVHIENPRILNSSNVVKKGISMFDADNRICWKSKNKHRDTAFIYSHYISWKSVDDFDKDVKSIEDLLRSFFFSLLV